MKLEIQDPNLLVANPWNTNRLSPEAELKLENSLAKGIFKPIICRELISGVLQILGGEHRNEAAKRMMWATVPVINLGPIDDTRAKEITVIDNGRYGQDDADALAKLLAEIGEPADIASFMPFDMKEMTALSTCANLDLDSIGFSEDDAPAVEPSIAKAHKTHVMMKFKVPIEDQSMIEATIKSIIAAQSYDDSDSSVRAGDALVWLISNFAKNTSEE